MSHPRYRLLDTVITSGSDVDRAVRGIKSFEGAPPGVGRDAPRTKVVAEGEGPAGEARRAKPPCRDFRVLCPLRPLRVSPTATACRSGLVDKRMRYVRSRLTLGCRSQPGWQARCRCRPVCATDPGTIRPTGIEEVSVAPLAARSCEPRQVLPLAVFGKVRGRADRNHPPPRARLRSGRPETTGQLVTQA